MSNDIAIIGMAGRFPEANTIENLYDNLVHGVDSVKEISSERVKDTALPPNKTYMKLGYLDGIDKFDYNFFKITPAEANNMDPIQRLLLEVTYETIENAGYNADALKGTKTSIYVGDLSSEYYTLADRFEPTMMTGNSKMFHASRVARQFDFRGNAMMVDSACSSSLVAVRLACNELLLGQSDYAFVEGINLYMFPYKMNGNDLDIWSEDGVSKAFSASANGMSRGEVVVSVLLKPLEKAIEDKDIIHAVIKGIAVNNNASRSSSPSAPDSAAQAEVLKEAWQKAQISPEELGYIEVHGSGTQLGDSLEIEGLNMAFREYTNAKHICPISTVKNNIGHGMAAAGLTGLVKAVLTLEKEAVFQTINFEEPNPIIDFKNSAVYVSEAFERLDSNKEYVGVTAIGASGVNCHVVLKKGPEKAAEESALNKSMLVTVSSKTESGLRRNADALYDVCMNDSTLTLENVAYTRNAGRKHYNHRHAFICNSMQDFTQKLGGYLENQDQKNREHEGKSEVILMFSPYDKVNCELLNQMLISNPLFHTYYTDCMKLCNEESATKKVFAFQYSLYQVLVHYGIDGSHIMGVGLGNVVSSVILENETLSQGLRKSVDFRMDTIPNIDARAEALVERKTSQGHVIFVEMGSGSILSEAILAVNGSGKKFDVVSTKQAMDYDPVTELMSELYNMGVEIDWEKYHQYQKGRRIELPAYQFEKERCWLRDEPKVNTVPISTEEEEQEEISSLLKEDGTYLQKMFAKLWCEVLNLESISLDDDFFEVGGDSLKATYIINELNGKYELNLDFEDIFDFPTIQLLCEYTEGLMTPDKKMCCIWKDVLKLDSVKPTDNFFDLGGHSLLANQILVRVHREFGIELNFENIFEYQTVTELSDYVEQLRREGTTQNEYMEIKPVEQQAYYQVSPQQKRTWILNQFKDGSIAYNTSGSYMIEGNLNYEVLDKTITALMERHESLRTVFCEVDGEPKQKVVSSSDMNLHIHKIDLRLEPKKEIRLKELIRELELKQFDLENGPLLRISLIQMEESKYIFVFVIHHIISDGWSLNVLFKDLVVIYNAFLEAKENPLNPLPIQYKDYAEWEYAQQESEMMSEQRSYWLNQLSGTLPVLELPYDKVRPAVMTFNGDKVLFRIDRSIKNHVEEVCRKYDCTLFMGLVTAINALLYRYTKQNDIILGFPIAGRKQAELENQIGYYVNTLPLRTQFPEECTFEELLRIVRVSTLGAYEHQQYHFDRIVSELNPKRDLSRNAIFDVMVVLQNSGNKNEKYTLGQGLHVEKYEIEQYTSKMDLLFEFMEENDEISVSIEFNTDIYEKSRIERMSLHLVNMLNQFAVHTQHKVNEVTYLSQDEMNFIFDFNQTSTAYPKELCIHDFLEAQAKKTPDKVALRYRERNITYEEFQIVTNKLANYLRKQNIGRESIVGICMKRSVEMLLGIYAILKAGAAYMPISVDMPEERITFMLEDSNAKALLVSVEDGLELSNVQVPRIDISDQSLYEKEEASCENMNRSTGLAYVIYTSGTTGIPKGVMIEHHSVINRLNWMQKMYPLTESDVLLQKTPYSFDVSVWELFWWTLAGASLAILNHGDEKNPHAIIQTIEQQKVTTIHFVPSMLEVFLEYVKNKGGIEKMQSLRQVFSSGEALLPHHADKFQAILNPQHDKRLINLYGPTEATVDVSYYECPKEPSLEEVYIGKPIDNMQLYILDEKYNLQPLGVAGELCIAGVGLARGYLNRTELTKEKFVENPFEPMAASENMSSQKGKLYKTGDIARLLPNGNIAYLGRIDHQVKIRGYRIELGEIEKQIVRMDGIKECIVVDVTRNGSKYLCAYIVGLQNIQPPLIRNTLLNKLPSYMIPDFYVQLDRIPLSANGKVNRKELPEPEIIIEQELKKPVNAVETELVKIWSEVLGVEQTKIGTNVNFFEMGGNSLNIITAETKIALVFSKNISVEDLFRYPTISSLAKFMKLGEEDLEVSSNEMDESVSLMEQMISFREEQLDEE